MLILVAIINCKFQIQVLFSADNSVDCGKRAPILEYSDPFSDPTFRGAVGSATITIKSKFLISQRSSSP